MTTVGWAMRFGDGSLAAMDHGSGSYPCRATYPAAVWMSDRKIDAENWARTMNGSDKGASYGGPFTVVRVRMTVEEVK